MKIEPTIILFSVLLLFSLGIRADVEGEVRARDSRILELQQQADIKAEQILSLQDKLKPLPYSQPLKQINITSGVDIRVNPLGGGTEALHRGVDMADKIGTPVYAVLAGRVVEHYLSPGNHNGKYYRGHDVYGCMVTIKHEDGFFSRYAHLSASYVCEDEWIEMGQIIGLIGSTGPSSGPHLHWEIIVDGFKYLNERVLPRDSE